MMHIEEVMLAKEMRFERSAIGDDVLTCPKCNSNSNLTIGWFPIDGTESKEFTRVGCKKCNIYFTEKDYWHALSYWNNYVITEFLKIGKRHKHYKLYNYLYQKAKSEKEANLLQDKINQYLEENISTRCKFSIGDIIRDIRNTQFNWIVRKIYSVYGANTGPFWIIKAQRINANGKFLEGESEFWERDSKFLEAGEEYYHPTRWIQLKPGSVCLHENLSYIIVSIEKSKREASLKNDIEQINITSLSQIRISVNDINET